MILATCFVPLLTASGIARLPGTALLHLPTPLLYCS